MKTKIVKQQCACCGHTFDLIYYEDGSYTYLGDTCDCESEFFPLGLSISEWIESLENK